MYNPQNLHECEKHKQQKHALGASRRFVDSLMTVIGVVASLSSIPQIVKIVQTGSVDGISLTTQLIALGAVISWFVYGIYIKNKPLIITSLISTVVLGVVALQIIFMGYL